MNPFRPTARHSIEADFHYPLYSPKGGVEGAMLLTGEDELQLVFEPDHQRGAEVFARMRAGTRVRVEARPQPVSDRHGEPPHRVFALERLVSVDGRPVDDGGPDAQARAPYSGIVVRLNFARHGEPNGFVLDSGDFIHARPEGMAQLQLGVGDRVEADGDTRPLSGGQGVVVEASVINGRPLNKPKRPAHA